MSDLELSVPEDNSDVDLVASKLWWVSLWLALVAVEVIERLDSQRNVDKQEEEATGEVHSELEGKV